MPRFDSQGLHVMIELNAMDKSVCQMHKSKCKDLPYAVESSPASIIPDGKDWTLKGQPPFALLAVNMSGFLGAC